MVGAADSIEKLESDLWEAADNLRANSKLTSSDYFMPVLGVIFLRHAANRFDAATRQIEKDQASGEMPNRRVLPADYLRRRALWLPENARYDWIMQQAATSGSDLPKLVTEAMTAIEAEFEPLKDVLPKDFGIFETKVLEDLMRLFNSEQIKQASGDVFGHLRILPCQILDTKGTRQWRVLYVVLNCTDHCQCHRTGSRHGVRSGLRIGRHVRAIEPLHRARGR
jgi:HsdM-like protein